MVRALDLVSQEKAPTSVSIRDGGVHLEIPTDSGTAYDTVYLNDRGSVFRGAGKQYTDEVTTPLIDVAALDTDVLTAMAQAAPHVYEEQTGKPGLPAARMEITAESSDEGYAGEDPDDPVITVWLANDEYGGGGGRISWTQDGSRVLRVTE